MRRRKLVWSATARRDLNAAFRYIEVENPKAAEDFVVDIGRKLRLFATSGLTGFAREDLGAGIRSFSHKQRIFFVLVRDDALFVVRMLHGHQNITPDDFPESET